ncbi:MAG: carboxypeptidase regulatory-like domain-containing protein [Kiritimatiellae bacterium]|nr:carboxypeptidase regulatory-like domain-containing protein [Kiritimatiellia bacterium]
MRDSFTGLIALTFALSGSVLADYNPYYNNALADVRLRIVDDEGRPVGGATVTAAFYISDTKTTGVTKEADADGIVEAKYPCNGEFKVWARKDGYYDTLLKTTAFITLSEKEATKARKWSNGPVDIPVTLKKRRNPAKLILKGGTFQELKYPATNVVMGLDLQRFDWCPPYGKGKYDDLQIKYDFWRSPTNWFQVYSHLDITMTNCLDGVYLVPTDDFSKMNRCYGADTNAVYLKALEYVYDRKTGNVERDVEMPRDKYMVYRTRTKVNDKGELVSANYGLIFEKSEYGIKLNMRTAFNPKPNDTNLECEGGWR